MKVLIASKNPGKIEGARKALESFFDNVVIEGVSVPSDVPDQPVDLDILQGAKNRVKNLKNYAKTNNIYADMFLAVESGITNRLGEWMITSIGVVEDEEGRTGVGTSPSFPVPERYVDEIIKTDLSLVMDKVFGTDRERHNNLGIIHHLTKGKMSRIDLNELAFTMALTRFIREQWN